MRDLAFAVATLAACSKGQPAASEPPPAGSGNRARVSDVPPAARGPEAELTPRRQHTATALPDGRVLIAGGDGTGATPTTFLFDGAWHASGAMTTGRARHVAVALADGRVLVMGGVDDKSELASAEIWDPKTATWTATPLPTSGRQDHRAVVLPDGRVLVVGGRVWGSAYEDDTIWDGTTWKPSGRLHTGRYDLSLTVLADGSVLAAGGEGTTSEQLSSVELRDPKSGAWKVVAPLTHARTQHCAALLGDGRVLVIGGHTLDQHMPGEYLASTESYDPKTNKWTPGGDLQVARTSCVATSMPDGSVVVTGGYASQSGYVRDIERFRGGTWERAGALGTGRSAHTATLLRDGRLLVTGGESDHDPSTVAAPELITLSR